MLTYKRNQSLEAASASFGQGPTPSPALKTNAKRLLDADRAFEYSPRSKDPERANYAFFSGKAPGSGVEVLFSSYEVFALRLGLGLLEHGWPQSTAVKVMRRVRPLLEPQHSQILSWDAAKLFDRKKILETAEPGSLAVSTTHPIYLVVARKGLAGRPFTDKGWEVAILDGDELMPFLLREAGRSSTVIELTKLAHDLQTALAKTTPSKRGRGSA